MRGDGLVTCSKWDSETAEASITIAIHTIPGGHNSGRKYCLQIPLDLGLDSVKLARLLDRASGRCPAHEKSGSLGLMRVFVEFVSFCQ